MTHLLTWDESDEFHAPGWFVGSEDEDGTHRRDETGWPYSIYRMNTATGGTDAVLCHGFQSIQEAYIMAETLNNRLGITRYYKRIAA